MHGDISGFVCQGVCVRGGRGRAQLGDGVGVGRQGGGAFGVAEGVLDVVFVLMFGEVGGGVDVGEVGQRAGVVAVRVSVVVVFVIVGVE